jgi:endogenous inhibitor of DNA gyrase (YacG/DUF329 family)
MSAAKRERLRWRIIVGEIADMMLDGELCAGCGAYIDDDGGEGFPRHCSPQCARDSGADTLTMTRKERHAARQGDRVRCPICRKRVKSVGLGDHVRDIHSDTQS